MELMENLYLNHISSTTLWGEFGGIFALVDFVDISFV
jgi:hypothetical protein